MFDVVHRSEIVAIFTALLREEPVEQPSWWSSRMTVDVGGLTAACAARANGPGRIMLYPFKGTFDEALARVTRPDVSISIWQGMC
jgi:hypothetical protein